MYHLGPLATRITESSSLLYIITADPWNRLVPITLNMNVIDNDYVLGIPHGAHIWRTEY